MPKLLLRFTWGLIIFQMIYWTLVPYIVHIAPPLDATEMYGWSLSFEWGFYKHPPMPTWIVAIVQMLVGKNILSLFLSASLAISFTYFAVAWLATQFLNEKEAIVALFLYALTIYCHLWSTDFNHNQIQMPFWALSICLLWITLEKGKTYHAFLLGVFMGLNALSKYTAALIFPCAILLLIFTKSWRVKIRWMHFLFAFIGFFLVFTPHLYWLNENDFMPFKYVSERFVELDKEKNIYLLLLEYIGNTLLAHLILVISMIYCSLKYAKDPSRTNSLERHSKNQSFLIWIGLGPFLLSCLIGLWVALYYRWVTPMLPMITIIVVYFSKGRFAHLYKKKFFIIFIILQLLFGMVYLNKAKWNTNSSRGNYPAMEITTEINQRWHLLYPNEPLQIVAGGEWEAGFVSLFSERLVYVFTHSDRLLAPWVTNEMVENCGMAMIAPTPKELELFPGAKLQNPIVIPQSRLHAEVIMPWAILPPKGNCEKYLENSMWHLFKH